MFSYDYIAHTADIRIHLVADSLEELFMAGVAAINGLIKPDFCQKAGTPDINEALDIESLDTTALLIDFLSELLTLSHTEHAVFCQVEFRYLTHVGLSARLSGYLTDGFEEDLKAVTYHEAEVRQNESGQWETMVVVDI